MFNMACDLESVCIDLGRVKDLLDILLEDVFDEKESVPSYIEKYSSLVETIFLNICEQEKEVRRVSNMLYEISRQISETTKTECKGA